MADFVDIGPECFSDTDENVVCWKGQEYVKTCGSFVTDLPDGGQAFCTLSYDHPGDEHINTHLLEDKEESPTVAHARLELELVGEDPDVIAWYLKTIAAFMSYGHSGGSFFATLPVLNVLLKRENITPLTDDPDEWVHHEADMWDGKTGIWQSKRNPKMFSNDSGKSYFNVDDPSDGFKLTDHTTNPREKDL
jgi:hypothetical protein